MDIGTLIDYFQDCSCFQSDSLGVGFDELSDTHCTWLLRSWQIVVNRFPKYGEYITICTWPYKFDNLYGYRNFLMKDKDDNVLASANSLWIYVDMTTNQLLKITPDITAPYTIEPRYSDIDYSCKKISIPKVYDEYKPVLVEAIHLDTNNHVNNSQYIHIAKKYFPKDFNFKQLRVEYKKQAFLGDFIIPRVSVSDHICTIVLASNEKQPYAVVELT